LLSFARDNKDMLNYMGMKANTEVAFHLFLLIVIPPPIPSYIPARAPPSSFAFGASTEQRLYPFHWRTSTQGAWNGSTP